MVLPAGSLKIGKNIEFYGLPIIQITAGSRVLIGDKSVLCSIAKFSALGVNHPVIIRTLSASARITIGRNCGLSGTVICATNSIIIGDGVLFGADVCLFDTDFHPIYSEERYSQPCPAGLPIEIGDNVFIGNGAKIIKGVSIGKNSVVAAGSVVTKSVPENSIAAGNPCRVIRSF
jgi:acetyltransferase-like isoleucine patch superfamily enzyme